MVLWEVLCSKLVPFAKVPFRAPKAGGDPNTRGIQVKCTAVRSRGTVVNRKETSSPVPHVSDEGKSSDLMPYQRLFILYR